ncbi:hypothetical protein ACFYOK_29310 [Microbispora bryophytorum]|uniref:hypothetical protein n=1 Tax=Microbispora bryophytorum TaxID=1460882 RepID=UPI00340AB394
MNHLLLAWVHGIFPPAHRPDAVSRWRFRRAAGDGSEERSIVMTETDVRETWMVEGRAVEDRSVMLLPPDETLAVWVSRRCGELVAEGWQLYDIGTTFDVT